MNWSKYDFAKRDFNEVKEEVGEWNSKILFNDLDLIVFFKNVLGKTYKKSEWKKSYDDYDVYEEVRVDNTHLFVVEKTFHTDSYEGRRTEESSRIIEDYSESWQEYLLGSYRIDKENLLKSLYVEDMITQKEAEESIADQMEKIESMKRSLDLQKIILKNKKNAENKRQKDLSKRVAKLDPETEQTNETKEEDHTYNLFTYEEEFNNTDGN